MRLTTTGESRRDFGNIVGILATSDVAHENRHRMIRLVAPQEEQNERRFAGYRGLLFCDRAEHVISNPHIQLLRESDHLRSGDIVVMDGQSGTVRSLYRPYEAHHHLFVTERCNSNCLMCSQPPKDRDDVEALLSRNFELIDLIHQAPPYLTITGGEPTLMGDHLFSLINRLKERMPSTELHMLTNGRTFAWPGYAKRFAKVGHPNISLGIPLYADVAAVHDFVVQAARAFDQTICGLHQAARNGIRVEIRVVLHKLTIPRLGKLADYIYRTLTFAEHVALMGLEYTGYTPRNIDQLWVDPYDYQDELEAAVEALVNRNMNVSIYNHQLCVLRKSLWTYARKSISDWKNTYLAECAGCTAKQDCGGLFQWAAGKHSAHIKSFD